MTDADRDRRPRGLTIFLTGLSGAGKTTLAKALCARLPQLDSRIVRLLDGDEMREHLSPGLGFSKEERVLHLQRVGYIAAEVTACRAIAVCAVIAPYDDARKRVRALVEQHGRFVLVYVSTPIAVCEQRDAKGLYARARAGEVRRFTGVSDPYEVPNDAEIMLDTSGASIKESLEQLVTALNAQGVLATSASLRN